MTWETEWKRGEDGAENNQSLTGAWCAHYYHHPGISYSVIKNIIPFRGSILRGFNLMRVFRRTQRVLKPHFWLLYTHICVNKCGILMIIGFIMHEVHAYISKSCLCAWQLFSHVLSFVPSSSSQRPLKRSTKRFPSRAGKIQPGPDPHLDQLKSICYRKYKFGNM